MLYGNLLELHMKRRIIKMPFIIRFTYKRSEFISAEILTYLKVSQSRLSNML
jgi:hypothetical protein